MRNFPPSTPIRLLAGLATTLAVTLGITACAPVPDPADTPTAATTGVDRAAPQSVEEHRRLLATLPVKGRAPMTGYDRELFGQAWADDVEVEFGRNGCDTRNDILRRDLSAVDIRPGTGGCLVEAGTLTGPYSGEEIRFTRGRGTSSTVQIDHVVALADAWAKGARQLDEPTRRNFANDPDNLLAVDGELNHQKGAGDAATWLPPNRAFRCEYAQRQITIKARYGLWVTEAERDALERQLDTCPRPEPHPQPPREDAPAHKVGTGA